MRSHKTLWLAVIPGCLLMILIASAVSASSVNVPNTFVAQTPALAEEVNANFAAVEDAINDNDSRVSQNTSDISTAEAEIAQLQTLVASLQANGVMKAAVVIEANGTVQRFFNSQGGTPTVDASGVGQFRVTFPGFTDMSTRFYSANVGGSAAGAPDGMVMTTPFGIQLADTVFIETADETGTPSDESFYLIIF